LETERAGRMTPGPLESMNATPVTTFRSDIGCNMSDIRRCGDQLVQLFEALERFEEPQAT
jgi:hypothetical protein